ncbi:SMC family ATPase [Candidatus Woesearchaeota archaeon]|nr:SMC family ATPase [Candidatus Woesearchaeota archaeon]
MRLKTLKLNNIRSYSDGIIHFSAGSTLLSGDIGSGKTSILLSIEFALFGFAGNVDGNALLRNGKPAGFVELTFEVDGKEVVVRRHLRRLKDAVRQESGYILVDGQKYYGTPVELKARILGLLGYPKELLTRRSLIYRYTVYTPQEEMKLIMTDGNSARLDTLRKVFQIDKYKRVKDNAETVLRILRQRVAEDSARAEGLADLRKKHSELSDIATETSGRLELLDKQLQTLEASISSQRKLYDALYAQEKVLAEHRRHFEVANAKAESCRRQASMATTELQSAAADLAAYRSSLAKAQSLYSEFGQLYNAALTMLSKLESGLKAKSELSEAQKNAQDELGKSEAELKKLEYVIEECRKASEAISSLGTCPTCMQPVSEEHKQRIRAQESSKIEASRGKSALHLSKKDSLRQKLAGLREEIERLNENARSAASLSAEVSQFRETAESIGISNAPVESAADMPKLREVHRQIRAASHIPQLTMEKERLIKLLEERRAACIKDAAAFETQAEKSKADIASLSGLEKEFSECRSALDSLLSREKHLGAEKAALAADLASSRRHIQQLQAEIDKKQELERQMESTRKVAFWLDEHFISLAGVMERSVMLRVYGEFNSFFQKWFSVLIDDQSLSIRLDEEFSPVIEQDGYEMTYDNLSGGERTSCALAYRLALNRAINDVVSTVKTRDLLILDEPTEGFSSQQLDRIRDVLGQLGIAQIIIVSHEPKIEGYVDNVIRVLKEEHASRIANV